MNTSIMTYYCLKEIGINQVPIQIAKSTLEIKEQMNYLKN